MYANEARLRHPVAMRQGQSGTDNIGVQGTIITEIPKEIDLAREVRHHLTAVVRDQCLSSYLTHQWLPVGLF
jgi:hypothetical protein